jgi:5'-3' exonuclease
MPIEFERILIDASYWRRKYFEVHKHLCHTVDGQKVWTGTAHGFLIGLCALREKYEEGKIIVCWDGGIKRRKQTDPTYKEERREKAKEWEDRDVFDGHSKILSYFLKLTGVCQAVSEGEEADDLIYTLATQAEGNALIVSNDHDFYQALGDGVFQLLSKKDGEKLYSARRLVREQGVTPAQYQQTMALTGCSGDGVPGVPGVGLKTAIQLVLDYPELVPALLGEDDTPLSEWAPQTNSKNIVTESTDFFEEGEKGPSKKLRDIIEKPWVVELTHKMTRLYKVDRIRMNQPKFKRDLLLKQLERAAMHECASRIDEIERVGK